jgi:Flp pilus assembly protein TadG
MGWERSKRGVRDPRRDSGAAAVEFALLLPIFLALTLAAIDFAMAFRVRLMLHGAAGQGATYAAVRPCDPAGVKARALQDLPSSDPGGSLADPTVTSVTVQLLDSSGADVTSAICTSGATTGNVTAKITVSTTYHLLTGTALGMFGVPPTLGVTSGDTVRVAGR